MVIVLTINDGAFGNWLSLKILKISARVHLLMAGVYWIDYKEVNFDYKKYLGPDWTPSFKGAGVTVANH